jgi:pimeloyl-ACP methyl ester carboxylesterase
MQSLFFGPSSRQLYGVYSPARADRERDEGIVFCYPFGQEYMRAHRPLRQLANDLANLGYHVLRFDYRGSGDSAGDMHDMTPDLWVEDTVLAIEHLRDIAALDSIAVVGLRLGSLLGTAAASQCRDITRLLLWDSVINGSSYVSELSQGLPRLTLEDGAANYIDATDCLHVNGFSMPLAFQQGLREMQLATLEINSIPAVLQLASHENAESEHLRKTWSGRRNVNYQLCPAPHDWNYVDHIGSILLPQPIMAAIRQWFS